MPGEIVIQPVVAVEFLRPAYSKFDGRIEGVSRREMPDRSFSGSAADDTTELAKPQRPLRGSLAAGSYAALRG